MSGDYDNLLRVAMEWVDVAWLAMFAKTVISLFTLKQSMVIYSRMSVVDVMLFMPITPQQESW
jgi:hypothetical protein